MMLKSFYFLALCSGLAWLRPIPAHSQAVTRGNPSLSGTWKGRLPGPSTEHLVFQPGGRGYVAFSPDYTRYPFQYEISKLNRLRISGAGMIPRVYSVTFLTASQVRFRSTTEPGEGEVPIIFANVVYQLQQATAATK
jgi:hypothetical protein